MEFQTGLFPSSYMRFQSCHVPASRSALKLLLSVLAVCIAPNRPVTQDSACNLQIRGLWEDYEYYQEGDIIIGGVLTVNSLALDLFPKQYPPDKLICFIPYERNYVNLLIFINIIERINNNPSILQNVTLGYHVYDSCLDTRKAVKSVLQILSGPRRTVPNYSCSDFGKLVGFIGDHYSSTTIPMAQILGVYGYTQISYGASDFSLGDKRVYPHFFRMVKNDHVHCSLVAKLLNYFGWNWIGIVTSDDDSGEQETAILKKYLTNYSICVDFTIKVSVKDVPIKDKYQKTFQYSSAQIIVICGPYSLTIITVLKQNSEHHNKTLIFPPSWATNGYFADYYTNEFYYSLAIDFAPIVILRNTSFLDGVHPLKSPQDMILNDLWMFKFRCILQISQRNIFYFKQYGFPFKICNDEKRLINMENLATIGVTPRVLMAVNALASAVAILQFNSDAQSQGGKINSYKNQLLHYVNNPAYKSRLPRFLFDENTELVSKYVIVNLVKLREIVGTFKLWAAEDQQLTIDSKQILWKTKDNEIPKSQCSENCLSGYRKVSKSAIHSCCYDCVQCSQGEISNVTDSENCIICPDEEWPNEKKDRCIPKLEEFLSYTDILAAVFVSTLFIFCLSTLVILTLFVSYKNTPIVKANNRNLSFILLVSIMLSFLSVFLFLGRPVDITCMLRQVSFGIIFSVAVSSVLAKTIMVYIAFKATRPGSMWKKWLGVKLSNSIVFMCSSVQILISISWLATSPPFQELDVHSYEGKIIIQCNEGSVIAFYSVLGYMGLLAAVSFIIAFLARNLPDSFNEAKYITFSMLVFCSVWIAMIPAYLSTKGKYMVAVEVFAILTSSSGLLCCIFFPKCYMILFRPEMNTKTYMFQSRN
ncbi:vomeronasal type-2 receptor 26-like [Pelodytes ibericus]